MTTDAPSEWGWGRIAGYTAIIAVIYVVAQVGAIAAVVLVQLILAPGFDVEAWADGASSDGLVVSAATIAAAMLCIPVVWFLVRRREPSPWYFLGVRRVTRRDLAIACGVMLLFIAITDPVNVWVFDRPLVPPFMTEAYATSRKPALLFVAIALVAPALEELLFRGFLFGVLRARGIRAGIVIVVTTMVFTALHTQYEFHDLAGVLLIGLLFGWARLRFDSVVPAMAMHALGNTIAFVETVYVAATSS